MPFCVSKREVPVAPAALGHQQTPADSQVLAFQLQCPEGGEGEPDANRALVFRVKPTTSCTHSAAHSNGNITHSRQGRHARSSARATPGSSSSSAGSNDTTRTPASNFDGNNADLPGTDQQQQPVVATGLVPALFLGDVFMTANTISGILNSTAAAAAEGHLPTARHNRAQRAAQQPVDPAAALLLQLMQPLPQPFTLPSGDSNTNEHHHQQQQQRKLFYVDKDSAEFVRQELLLKRYHEVVAARAAAGRPTTPVSHNNNSSSSSSSAVPEHRWDMVLGLQAAATGDGSISSRVGHHQQQQQQQHDHGVGQMLRELHKSVARVFPRWGQAQQQQQQHATPSGSKTTAAALPAPPVSPSTASSSNSSSSGGGGGGNALGVANSSSSSSGMIGAKHSLPAALAAQYQSFMSDLATLEEEELLREGQHIMEQRRQQQRKGHRGNRMTASGSHKTGVKKTGSSSGTSVGDHGMFNFASYVARMPLFAAMRLLHTGQEQQQQQQQHDDSTGSGTAPTTASAGTATAAPSSSSSSSQSKYDLAVSAGDLRACIAIQRRDAFVDLDDNDMESNAWQLGIYEATSDEDESAVEDIHQTDKYITNNQQNIAAAAAVATPDQASAASSSSRRGRWRWGKQQQQQQEQQQQQQPAGCAQEQHDASVLTAAGDGNNDHASQHPHMQPDPAPMQQRQQRINPSAEYGSAAYHPLDLPGSSSSGSAVTAVPLSSLVGDGRSVDEYGEVKVELRAADLGVCDRTPVFQIPGLELVLASSVGEVSFTPTFLSLSHLITMLHTAKQAATKMWVSKRRTARQRWRRSVEMAAVSLATGGSSGGRYGGGYGSSRGAAAAAAEESEDDEDGMGDLPDAKALLEELGEAQPQKPTNRSSNTFGDFSSSGGGSGRLPTRTGVVGALNAIALGTISLAAAAACGVQEVADAAAVAVPAIGEWMIGFPTSVNVRGTFLEDVAAAAAQYNASRLKVSQPLLPASKTSPLPPPPAAAAALKAAGAITEGKGLYDPLELVNANLATQQQQQQQQRVLVPTPAVTLPCLDGLRLLVTAGWSIVCDVLVGDGRLAAHIMAGRAGGRTTGLGTVQVSEEGEVAVRLGLAVMAAQQHTSPLAQLIAHSTGRKETKKPEPQLFEVGIHLNLSHLIGRQSMQRENQLSAARGGLGSAGKGVLLIGDLALEPSEMAEAMWRGPHLGFGTLPVAPLVMAGQPHGDSARVSSSNDKTN